jgi:thiamine-monophosphate kinase
LIRRGGARPGDHVFVTGTIGDAGTGLRILRGELDIHDAWLIERYRVPRPRLQLGMALRGVASAALDVSDGLLADLGHLADTSQVRVCIDAKQIPLSSAFRNICGDSEAAIARAVTAGDDYEVAFTSPVEASVMAAAAKTGTSITRIGVVEAGVGVCLRGYGGVEMRISRPGFVHF